MKIEKLIETYSKLGNTLIDIANSIDNNKYTSEIQNAIANNAWFTKESIKLSIQSIGQSLHKDKLHKWLSNYNITTPSTVKTVGVIMAGNIPLVGFSDLICVLIAGHNILIKLSSKDQFLYKIIKDILVNIDNSFEKKITFTSDIVKNIDIVIATGSNNSSRYFEYYFSKYPNIIRKNRNSIAIITGNESETDLYNLGNDIFSYFGLGCRNVSFLLVPDNYDFSKMMIAFQKYNEVNNHTKYYNNYEYQKAIMLMNQIHIYDNGNILLRESDTLSSPISVLNYKYYSSDNEIDSFVDINKSNIQCIVSKTNFSFATYELGEAQKPELWDYADNIDTLEFLLKN